MRGPGTLVPHWGRQGVKPVFPGVKFHQGILLQPSPLPLMPNSYVMHNIQRLMAAILPALLFMACTGNAPMPAPGPQNTEEDKKQISAMLDSFNVAAATADYQGYFSFFAPNAVFIGTDATEYWTRDSFMVWAKPYFDKKGTWNFTALERHIYTGAQPGIAWFDELLNTQMKICRGSGVVEKKDGAWKVQQYVLSMTVPNSQLNPVLKLKAPQEDSIIGVLKAR